MDNIKEKLVELFQQAKWVCTFAGLDSEQNARLVFEQYADHLIANGVTIQEWIPVEERLPEVGQRVLVWCESRTIKKHVTVSTYMKDYSNERFQLMDGGKENAVD